MTELVTKAEYARKKGWSRSTVTRAAKAGRLVVTTDGKIEVAASDQRYADTADPNRDDVAGRHAAGRGSDVMPTKGDEHIGKGYQAARAVKEKFAAMTAKMEYEKAIGKLVEREEVVAIVADVIIGFRQAMENRNHSTAPRLVGKDQDAVRAILKEEDRHFLQEMERGFAKQLEALGETDE